MPFYILSNHMSMHLKVLCNSLVVGLIPSHHGRRCPRGKHKRKDSEEGRERDKTDITRLMSCVSGWGRVVRENGRLDTCRNLTGRSG